MEAFQLQVAGSPNRFLRSSQLVLEGIAGGTAARIDTQFAEDRLVMRIDRVRA